MLVSLFKKDYFTNEFYNCGGAVGGNYNEYKIAIISLAQNNSYNIDQIIPINSKLLKIIELNDSNSIASFELSNEIKIYSKSDLNYINTTTIEENNFGNFKDSLYLGNDKLIISTYSYKFYNLKDMKCIHEINNLQFPIGEIIKLDENKILVSSSINEELLKTITSTNTQSPVL